MASVFQTKSLSSISTSCIFPSTTWKVTP